MIFGKKGNNKEEVKNKKGGFFSSLRDDVKSAIKESENITKQAQKPSGSVVYNGDTNKEKIHRILQEKEHSDLKTRRDLYNIDINSIKPEFYIVKKDFIEDLKVMSVLASRVVEGDTVLIPKISDEANLFTHYSVGGIVETIDVNRGIVVIKQEHSGKKDTFMGKEIGAVIKLKDPKDIESGVIVYKHPIITEDNVTFTGMQKGADLERPMKKGFLNVAGNYLTTGRYLDYSTQATLNILYKYLTNALPEDRMTQEQKEKFDSIVRTQQARNLEGISEKYTKPRQGTLVLEDESVVKKQIEGLLKEHNTVQVYPVFEADDYLPKDLSDYRGLLVIKPDGYYLRKRKLKNGSKGYEAVDTLIDLSRVVAIVKLQKDRQQKGTYNTETQNVPTPVIKRLIYRNKGMTANNTYVGVLTNELRTEQASLGSVCYHVGQYRIPLSKDKSVLNKQRQKLSDFVAQEYEELTTDVLNTMVETISDTESNLGGVIKDRGTKSEVLNVLDKYLDVAKPVKVTYGYAQEPVTFVPSKKLQGFLVSKPNTNKDIYLFATDDYRTLAKADRVQLFPMNIVKLHSGVHEMYRNEMIDKLSFNVRDVRNPQLKSIHKDIKSLYLGNIFLGHFTTQSQMDKYIENF